MTLFVEIESIEEVDDTSDVYDIEVESDHNFFANGILVHNCLAGAGSWCVLQNWEKGDDEVFKALDKDFKPLLDIFGKERANIEIQFNKLPEQKLVNEYLIEYSKKTGYPLLATADSHYSRPEHWREREIYRMLAQQSKGYDIDVNNLPKAIDELKCQLYPKSGDQMFDSYCEMYDGENNPELDAVVLEAIERSYKIAHEQIEDVSPDSKMKLPKAFLKGADPNKEIRTICESSLDELSKSWPEEKTAKYKERLELELGVITKKDFSLYFLALAKAIEEIKKEMLVNAGRGSGAGSLVCYLMKITLVDPVEHGLLFERFLSEARNEPPDIDSDFSDRDKAIDILKRTFGADNVISISNFNTLQLKSLVKDISKLYQIPYEEVNAVTSVMEDEARQPILDSIGNDQKLYVFDLDGAYKFSPTFKNFLDKYPKVEESIKVLFKQLKAIGKHAGGVVITENPEDNMPIIRIRGVDQTPWGEGLTAKHLEPFGFVKYDFLGIATLRVIEKCIERVLKKSGQDYSFSSIRKFYEEYLTPDVVGQGEEEVFKEIYHKGKFCGIFQFAERAAQDFCKNAKPTSVGDISNITSIFRPGPLKSQADKKYVHLNDNPEDIDFYHPIIKEVLGATKGLLVYQEQFMLLAHKLAGFSLVEADELRKLLVKPITSLGEQMKVKRIEVGEKFIAGCIESGISEGRAKKLWNDEILGFISYGFALAHGFSYAYLSYQCAYLFYYYPEEWICAYLENDPNKDAATAEVEALGYKIGALDILSSGREYTIVGDTVYPPFSSVKGIGDIAVEELISVKNGWQKTNDPVSNFESFFWTIEQSQLKNGTIRSKRSWKFTKFNKRALLGLVRLEALWGLGVIPEPFKNHAHMLRVFEKYWNQRDKQKFDLLAACSDPEISTKDFEDNERVTAQNELVGTFDKSLVITSDVIDFLRDQDIMPLEDLSESPTKIWFILKDVDQATTKNGKPYFKLTISDFVGKEHFLNYWYGEPRSGWKHNSVYWAELFRNKGWINTKHGSYIQPLTEAS